MSEHRRDPQKERFWRSKIQQHQQSKLNIREFCAQHRISENNFYAWRRELQLRDQEQQARPGPAPEFVPVTVVESSAPTPIDVVLSCGHTVRLQPGFDPQMLMAILSVLEPQS